MRKILLILLAFASLTLSAQNEQMREMMRTTQNSRTVRDVPASNIQYWVGHGSNAVVATFFFCADEPIGIAYGYRFDGTATIGDMLNAITEADENFSCEISSWIESVSYNDGEHDCVIESGMLMYTVNGNYASGYTDEISDGDYFELTEWGDCELPTDNIFYPVNPNADATISADEIEYWIGEGENEAILIVQWCDPEIAFAWGYRFDGEVNVQTMLDDITAEDSRITYEGDASVVNQIYYNDDDYSLALVGWYWMYNMNGWMAGWGYTDQTITDGDVVKWGDTECATEVGDMADWENFTYIWTTEVTPVSNPNGDELEDATIDADEITYWVGEGENEVVVAITWCEETETALAWGYRFDGEATLFEALTAIANDDDRLTVVGTAPSDIQYEDDEYSLNMTGDYPMHSINGVMGQNYMGSEPIHDGDFAKIGGYDCSEMSSDWTTITWSTPIEPATDPNAPEEVVDATISADEVEYWLGEGENQVVVAISWCSNTQAALAWGYRFHGDATVFDALTAIAAADSRLAVVGTAPTNITYQDGTLDLTMCPNPSAQWTDPDYDVPMHSVNGAMGQNAMSAEPIHDNDFVKIGGMACGIFSDDWSTISWTTTINPATAPTEVGPSDETFDGIVGTEGCQGIHCQDPAILGWATTCTIERGRQNITTPGVFVTYGTESDGVGAATEATGDVVSLGDYGIAVLTFDIPIQNGDGYDFAVFENSLNDSFLEMAFVEVSSDGVNYFRFPAISNSDTTVQVDNGGSVDATLIHNLAGKYRAGWGTPFDLEELAGNDDLDINNITHIRLVDVVGCVAPRYATRDSRGHIINDPYPTPFHSSGFDLDGVCVLNGWRPNGVEENTTMNHTLTVYPNPCHSTLTLNTEAHDVVMLFNMQGALLQRVVATDITTTLNMQDLPAGMYIVRCGNQSAKVVKQ